MFFKMSEYVRRSKILGIPHRGVVEKNDDPKQTGRVKVAIQGLWDGIELDKRPWVYPQYPAQLGATEGHISAFMVPRIGSQVVVTFPYDDVYFPFYVGHWDTEKTKAFQSYDENYPDVYGFTDPTGNKVKVNMATNVIVLTHSSGTKITVGADGGITVDDVADVKVNAQHIKLDDGTGVITMESQCPFTGSPHCDGSSRVFAGK